MLRALQPYFASCFRTQAVVQAAAAFAQQQPAPQAAQQQQANQQQAPVQQPAVEQKLQVLAAAAHIGGWWQPSAESDGGAAQQLALQAIEECFGRNAADAVSQIVRCVLMCFQTLGLEAEVMWVQTAACC